MPNLFSPAKYPHFVPFLDPDTLEFRAIPYSSLGPHSQHQILTLPRLPRFFDVYLSYDQTDHVIVTHFSEDVRGKYWARRIHHSDLPGWRAGIMPMILRRKRQLWVGAMPPAVALEGVDLRIGGGVAWERKLSREEFIQGDTSDCVELLYNLSKL